TVEDDWHPRATCDFPEMLKKPFLRRLVVIWCNLERAICADFFRVLSEINSFGRGVASCAGEHFDFARSKFHRELDDSDVLVVIDRWRFPCSADRHDTVHAGLDLNLDQSLERGFVDFAVRKWRNYCRVSSSKHVEKSETL